MTCDQRTIAAREPLALDEVDKLSRVLRVPVNVDHSGWVRDSADLVFIRVNADIRPMAVMVGEYTPAASVRQVGDLFDVCERYNRVVARLKLAATAKVNLHVAIRYRERMGFQRVCLETLVREIDFLENLLKEVTGCSS